MPHTGTGHHQCTVQHRTPLNMSLVTDLVLFIILAYIIHGIISWIQYRWRMHQTFILRSIPGPKPSFLDGNFNQFIHWPHTTLDRWLKKYGNTFGYFQGSKPILVLANINDVQEVLVKLGRQFPNRLEPTFNEEPFLSSLINLRGDRWKRVRRIITPSFTAHKLTLETSKQCIDTSVERLLEAIEAQRSQEWIDLSFNMKNVTLDVILRLAFNMGNTDVHEPSSDIREMTTAFMLQSQSGIIRSAVYFPLLKSVAAFIYNYLSSGRFITVMMKEINKSICEYNILKMNQIQDQKVNILDFMLEQKEQGNLSEMEIIGNCILVLLAGFETTANGLTFALYLLAKHPEIQEKLREELQSIYKSELGHCQFDEHRCELLDRVWIESLRLYPPVVSFVTRELDDNLEKLVLTSGVTITKDICVQIPVWSIHHNSDHWPNPYKFNPYRDNLPVGTVKSNAFLAFGAGPRNCIGYSLAMSEARAVISGLLLKYRIKLAEEHPVDSKSGLLQLQCPTVVAFPAGQIRIQFVSL